MRISVLMLWERSILIDITETIPLQLFWIQLTTVSIVKTFFSQSLHRLAFHDWQTPENHLKANHAQA